MLKVFASTHKTQGQRANDFNFVPEGEIVTFPMMTCSNETADGRCGCCRSMSGVVTAKGTTTMKVVGFDGILYHLHYLIYASLKESGWIDGHTKISESGAWEIVQALTDAASPFPVGTIVEYRDGKFTERQPVAQEAR